MLDSVFKKNKTPEIDTLSVEALDSVAARADDFDLEDRPSFFGRLAIKLGIGFDKETAFYGILVCAVHADGVVTTEEAMELQALTHRTKTLGKLSGDELENVKLKIAPYLERNRLDALLKKSARRVRGKSRRIAVFAHACDLLLADKFLRVAERDFVKILIARLRIDQDVAESIVRALVIKNAY